MQFSSSRPAARQRGAAMAAFVVTALPLLFCALFVVEAARWHITRQMLNLALLDAARAGATSHARPAVIDQAFETALLPLFHPPGRHGDARARMRANFLEVAQQTGAMPWRIDVVAPAAPAYADFGDASLRVANAPGLPTIRNDYQAEQHLRRRRMGWPGGRGPRSGQTIFEANTLRLSLSYAHPPSVPGLRAVLRGIAAMHGSNDPAARAGMLVIAMEMELPMQSHPVQWQRSVDGHASRAAARFAARPSPRPKPGPVPAQVPGPGPGPWVTPGNSRNDAGTSISSDTGHAWHPVADPGGAALSRPRTAVGTDTKTYPYVAEDLQDGTSPSDDDAACGVILCCVKSPPA
jgi:hypothetical protein